MTKEQVRSVGVIVEVPITGVTVMLPVSDVISSLNSYTFTINVTQGTAQEFCFDFGDGTENVTARAGSTSHSFGIHSAYLNGSFSVTYNATFSARNNVSAVVKSVVLVVYKPMLPIKRVAVVSNPANVSEIMVLNIVVGQGSDFVCSVYFGDYWKTEIIDFGHLNYLGEVRRRPNHFSTYHLKYSTFTMKSVASMRKYRVKTPHQNCSSQRLW